MTRVFVLGIDGAMPEKIFGDWKEDLPNLNKIISESAYTNLKSTIPPLSVTAWSSIYTGKNPSDTGIFEYVYRKPGSQTELDIVSSRNLKEKTVWQIASEAGKKSIVCFVNLTWPIVPFNGILLGDPLAPTSEKIKSIYPEELKKELLEYFGEIPPANFSVLREESKEKNFREMEKENIIEECYDLTKKHIRLMKYLMRKKEWDLFFGVIGISDRMNHAFWKYEDKDHRKYDPDSKFKNSLKDYYIFLDKKIGEIKEMIDEDTILIILSDHGILRMHNRVNLTDWLIKEGYLFLKEPIQNKTKFKLDLVDWEKTRVFAIGAYEGQIFVNLKGKEPKGIVDQEELQNLLAELKKKLFEIKGDDGTTLNTKIFEKGKDFSGKANDIAPHLIVYFDDLKYGCNTTLIGNDSLWSPQTARGSDDSGHSREGIFIITRKNLKGNIQKINAIDVAPTILNSLGVEIPREFKGKIIE